MDVLAIYKLCGKSVVDIRIIASRTVGCGDHGVHIVKAS